MEEWENVSVVQSNDSGVTSESPVTSLLARDESLGDNTTSYPFDGGIITITTGLELTLMTFTLLAALIGNGAICWLIHSQHSLRTSTNILILNLAWCDGLTSLIGTPFSIFSLVNVGGVGERGVGHVMCQMNGFLTTLFSLASVMTLALIAANRCCLIVYNTSVIKFTIRNTRLAILALWLFSSLCAALPLIGWSRYEYLDNKGCCSLRWSTSPSYAISIFTFAVIAPFSVMTFCYYKLLVTVRNSRRRVADMQTVSRTTMPFGMLAANALALSGRHAENGGSGSGDGGGGGRREMRAKSTGSASQVNTQPRSTPRLGLHSNASFRSSMEIPILCLEDVADVQEPEEESVAGTGSQHKFQIPAVKIDRPSSSDPVTRTPPAETKTTVSAGSTGSTNVSGNSNTPDVASAETSNSVIQRVVRATAYTHAWVDHTATTMEDSHPRRYSLNIPTTEYDIERSTSPEMELPGMVDYGSRSSLAGSNPRSFTPTGSLLSLESGTRTPAGFGGRRLSLELPSARQRLASLESANFGQFLSVEPLHRSGSTESVNNINESVSSIDSRSSVTAGSPGSSQNELRPLRMSRESEASSTTQRSVVIPTAAITRCIRRPRPDEMKTTFTIMVVILVFIISWLPLCIVNFLETFTRFSIPRYLDRITIYLLSLECAVNPLIYGAMNRNFREGFKKVFCTATERN